MPRFLSSTVAAPSAPSVAMNTNASGKPAKYANTPDALETTRRSMPLGLPAITAVASQIPNKAPRSEVQSARTRLFSKAALYSGDVNVDLKFANVRPPLLVVTEP